MATSAAVLFLILLAITFAVVWVIIRPRSEMDLRRRLMEIGSAQTTGGGTLLKPASLSSTRWVDKLLRATPGARALHQLIAQSRSRWTVGELVIGSGAAAVVTGGFCLLVSSPPLAMMLGAAAAAAPTVYLLLKKRARFKRFNELLPETVELMARALRAGHSVVAAVEMIADEIAEPVGSEFRTVFEQQNLGLPFREAVLNLTVRVPLDDIKFLATAILIQKETGGNLAEILDRTAAVLRDRIRLKGQVKIYTAQARVTGWVLCTLPFAIFLLMSFVNPGYEKQLWINPGGLHLIYAGLAMMAIGIIVIRKIIDIRV